MVCGPRRNSHTKRSDHRRPRLQHQQNRFVALPSSPFVFRNIPTSSHPPLNFLFIHSSISIPSTAFQHLRFHFTSFLPNFLLLLCDLVRRSITPPQKPFRNRASSSIPPTPHSINNGLPTCCLLLRLCRRRLRSYLF